MSRGKKLLIVGLVLAAGLLLAWPFRKIVVEKNYDSVASADSPPTVQRQSEQVRQSQPAETQTQSAETSTLRAPAPHVVAKMTSTGDPHSQSPRPPASTSFDLANHPALAAMQMSAETRPSTTQHASPVTPAVPPQEPAAVTSAAPPQSSSSRPAYNTGEHERVFDAAQQRPREIRHVVQNSDTLEKLAKRYLGDEGRALEIFDLNRDVLDNPHLLPINAELRIPADARATFD